MLEIQEAATVNVDHVINESGLGLRVATTPDGHIWLLAASVRQFVKSRLFKSLDLREPEDSKVTTRYDKFRAMLKWLRVVLASLDASDGLPNLLGLVLETTDAGQWIRLDSLERSVRTFFASAGEPEDFADELRQLMHKFDRLKSYRDQLLAAPSEL